MKTRRFDEFTRFSQELINGSMKDILDGRKFVRMKVKFRESIVDKFFIRIYRIV